MKKISILCMSMLLLMLAGCSNDDENGNTSVNLYGLVGKWDASHHSNNPDYGDTCDMWEFTFFADGTGTSDISTRQFKYELKGKHIILHFLGAETYYGQVEYEFIIEHFSSDHMEWEEVNNGYSGNNTIHLKLYRADYKNLIEPHRCY